MWAHLSQFFAMDPNPPILAKNPKDPFSNQVPPVAQFSTMASGNPQRPLFPSAQGEDLPFLHAGVVHIWYYIPLSTIFAQQSNGDVFRTQSHDSKSRSQNQSPILKEDLSDNQSGNPWQLSEDLSRTPTTWPCRSWVGNSSRIIPRAILRASFNQLSRPQVLQYSLNNSIGPYGQQSFNLYVLGPIWPIHIPLSEINHTVQLQRWPGLFWPNSDNTASDSPSMISLSTFHIYWPPFITWGLFPQLINILELFLSLFSLPY
ncbi:hypothetical protein O181_095844 [Austropuccinia psidii MF-1]|uniref:Uncharacterized protein n=1 Tax=Austropuccinia psidii MF-1 TaxID=1389203 RepID=A0A9Q3PC55_9BASI|nr:hypothetical protein [Austropuccinia psidii MF-1]